MSRVGVSMVFVAAGCSSGPTAAQQSLAAHAERAQLSLAADDRMVSVPAGKFIAGSTPEERAAAYDDFQTTAGSDSARQEHWFDREADRHSAKLAAFRIDLMPVTQAQYAELVADQRIAPPSIDEASWRAQGFAQDFASQVARNSWLGAEPPHGREDHPVVLVAWADAERYCAWRGALRGETRWLPSAEQLEKAARGDGGVAYPWGNAFEADKLNSAVRGPGDTTPAGNYPAGASPYGALDMAGNVREWSATPASGGMIVKGSAWIDFGGMGRGASQDVQPKTARHIAIGFRCAGPATSTD